MRRLRLLLVGLVAVGSLALVPAPASADADVCTGVAEMTLSYRAGLYQVHPWSFASVTIRFTPGGCVMDDLVLDGYFSGWCGYGWGVGTMSGASYHSYAYQWAGPQLVFTDPLTATFTFVEAPNTGLCATGNATRFVGTGVVVKQHIAP